VNLPNSITAGRIAVTPLIAWLPLMTSWSWRAAGFALFLIAAISDHWDGHLARKRNSVTDLGRLLDPLADKALLVATLLPMFHLQRSISLLLPAHATLPEPSMFVFDVPGWRVGFPLWILLVVVAREAFMTVLRQVAARKGIIISAIGPAKWKTGFQSTWVGAAYCWFAARTLAEHRGWLELEAWRAFAQFNGMVGTISLVGAVVLTVWSLGLYLHRYGAAVWRTPMRQRAG
jgi:CDP-diacylglycerol---glycerol-3-phosphate 3-phosphatidyltransferase